MTTPNDVLGNQPIDITQDPLRSSATSLTTAAGKVDALARNNKAASAALTVDANVDADIKAAAEATITHVHSVLDTVTTNLGHVSQALTATSTTVTSHADSQAFNDQAGAQTLHKVPTGGDTSPPQTQPKATPAPGTVTPQHNSVGSDTYTV